VASDNLRTIIVSKEAARTRTSAERLARPYVDGRLAAPREAKGSWRFRQRPAGDFVKGSFRFFPLPHDERVVLVYGKLKRSKNPSKQRLLQFRDGDHEDLLMAEWDFWMALRPKISKAKNADELRLLIAVADRREIKSVLVRGLVDRDIADRARKLNITRMKQSTSADERVVRLLRENRIGNPGKPRKKNKGKPSKKTKSVKAPKYVILRSPKSMPDPGPCSWLGSIVEWAWELKPGDKAKRVDENGNALWDPRSEWMFMWSPKYKAVVSIKRPRNMYKLAEVSRYGGAAKMFEVFMARPAENTFEIIVPDVPIQKLGKKAAHIVYRSDKWSPKRLKSDYIHPFGKGVELYCGPSVQNPQVFLCYGGKLTLTKRGLVW